MKKIDLKTLEKMLEEQNSYWICPVSGKKIDSKDVAAIDKYKKELIVTTQKEQDLKQKQKDLKKIRGQYKALTSWNELTVWIGEFLSIALPNLKVIDQPMMTVEATKPFKEAMYVGNQYALIKLSNIPAGYIKELKKISSIIFIRNSQSNENYLQISPFTNKIGEKIFEFQKNALVNNSRMKIGLYEKKALENNTTYIKLRDEMKEINKSLHDLRETHNIINTQMEQIRQNVINQKIFDYSETKTLLKKKI